MYAIVSTGGKQYKVAEGDVLDVEKLDAKVGDSVKLDCLLINSGTSVVSDPAKLAKKQVVATVKDQHKGDKVTVFKFHKRKRYQRTNGHRQNLTSIEIKEIPSARAAAKKTAAAE